MELPTSCGLKQPEHFENLSEEAWAAEILERHGYRTCIVGGLALALYGSDAIVFDIHIAVADDEIHSALETLLEYGYSEDTETKLEYESIGPAKDCSSGWPGYQLSGPSPINSNFLLIPSSLWHFDLNGPSFLSDTFIFPGSMCRFPHLESYLNSLIHTLAERVPDSGLNFTFTLYIKSQYCEALFLMPSECRQKLPTATQFFIRYFRQMLFPSSRIKFFSLWQRVRDGSLSVNDAMALLPKRDMRIAEMKAEKTGLQKMV